MANGWTSERRARQAELIRKWKPWQQSTGPKTETGKSTSSSNSKKHGMRSRDCLERMQYLNGYIRECKELQKEQDGRR